MQNAQCTVKTALFAALALLAAEIFAQATETGGAAGFAGAGLPRLDAAWAFNNHVRASAYYEDYDNDTLENWAEAALGNSPWTNDVAGISVATAKAVGALDLVPGAWKAAHGLSSPLSWSEDPDGDGWDNWSEWMAGTDPNAVTNRPNPRLAVTLDYHAALAGRLVIWAYSRADMNGWPDAVYVRDIAIGAPPATVWLTDADLVHGHLRQGVNWFFAWVGSGSGTPLPAWRDGEPAAIADNQLDGIDIGFDLDEVTFHLTDRTESFARFSWAKLNIPDGMFVEIYDDGNVGDTRIFRRIIEWPRTWLHEWDIISWNIEKSGLSGADRKNFGLGALYAGMVNGDEPTVTQMRRTSTVELTPKAANDMYEFGTIPDYCVISNWTHSSASMPQAVAYAPVNREIVASSTVEFRFSLDPEYTEFTLTLRKVTSDIDSGTRVFSERVLAPGRFYNDATGRRDLVIWRFPYCVGETIVSSGSTNQFDFASLYRWRISAYSPALRTAPNDNSTRVTAWEHFRTPAPDAGWRVGTSVYAASAHTDADYGNRVRVRAYPTPACSGLPSGVCQDGYAAGLTNRICGLPGPGPWYLRAESRDAVGFAAHGKRPVPVFAEPAGALSITNRIVIRDCK